MSKRKSNSSRKSAAARPDVAKPALPPRAGEVADLASSSDGEGLQPIPETETRLPEPPGQETVVTLPPVPPLELDTEPALASDLEELKPDVVSLVGAGADASEFERTTTGGDATAAPAPKPDKARRTIVGIEAYQTLFVEMTRDNLDLAASLASMRSPVEFLSIATKFAGRQMDLYGKFTKAVADIAAPDVKAR